MILALNFLFLLSYLSLCAENLRSELCCAKHINVMNREFKKIIELFPLFPLFLVIVIVDFPFILTKHKRQVVSYFIYIMSVNLTN